MFALPGDIIGYDPETNIPIVLLESLDLLSYKVLKKFNPQEHLPEENYKNHAEYFRQRNRTVYLSEGFVIKIWQKDHPSTLAFLSALHAHFFNQIAPIEGLIFDESGSCRGYITPYMISRTFDRAAWESWGFVLEKNGFGVKIFSRKDLQPSIYQDLFDWLIAQTEKTGFLSTDFCPNNVVIDPVEKRLYLIDLEDILEVKKIEKEDPEIEMVLEYNPRDYLETVFYSK